MWRLGRTTASEAWAMVGGPERVVVGRHGLAWGSGELTPASPPGPAANGQRWRLKREGDGCAPAGVFRLPFAFGRAASLEASWVRLPYQQTSPTLRGVDDPASRYYNQVVDEVRLPDGGTKDWTSSEEMLRADGVYDWGVFVGHNHPKPVGGPEARGSCIFLHRWSGPRAGTAGCTAMSPATLHDLLRWLDPAAEPVLVQTVDGS
jgi:L,D-peptidoglycan transpeptidase YkuD (ErfK/YbiS/YcfS/YnhG family)